MIDIQKILKHNVMGKLFNHGLVFLINILIARALGAGESGVYFNELYVLNFAVFIASAGLDYAAIALLVQEPALLPRLQTMLMTAVGVFSVVLIIVVLLGLPNNDHSFFKQPAATIILFSIGNLMLIFYQGLLSAQKKFNLQNYILIVSNLLFLVYLYFFLGDEEPQDIFKSISLGYALLFFFQGMLMYAFSHQHTYDDSSAMSWKRFIRSGFYIMLSSLIYFAFLRVDNFFIERYCDKTTLGNYVQCGKIGQYFLYFSSVISSTLLPFIAKETIGASYAEWKKMMRPYILSICIAAIVIAITGNYLFPLFFGNDFTAMYKLMLILLPGFICLGILTLVNVVYIGKGNFRMILIGDIIGLTLVIVFDALFVPRYGAYAAAIISSISYCLVFLFLLTGFKKQFLLPAKEHLFTKK